MKKFIVNTICFLLCASIVLLSCEAYYFYSGKYQENVNGEEVYYALRKSLKKNTKKKKLILGDSVAMQMYPCSGTYDDYNSLACNAAISVAGHYFLLKNFLENNTDELPEEVIFLVNPFTLENNLTVLSFHYFLKPFNTKKYKSEFTENLITRIKQTPNYWLTQLPFIRSSSYNINYELPPKSYYWISPISNDYLQKMIDICEQYNVVFRMIPSPIREDRREEIMTDINNSYNNDESDLLTTCLFKDYIDCMVFYPNNHYKDNIHFENNFIPCDYLKNK